MKKWRLPISLFLSIWICFSCNDKNETGEYDPLKPVKLISFLPDTGRIASTVILKGENFGTDPSLLNVYFNNKKASVVGVNNGHAYVLTPRMPGDTCVISVVVGNDSLSYDENFYYKISSNVTTYLGKETTVSAFVGGTFADTEFSTNIAHVHFDLNNIMLLSCSSGGSVTESTIMMVDEAGDLTKDCWSAGQTRHGARVMDTDPRTGITYAPDRVGDVVYALDPQNLYVVKQRLIGRPSSEQIASGEYVDWGNSTSTFKHSLGFCHHDEFFYTRFRNGNIVKWDPEGANVGTLIGNPTSTGIGDVGDSQIAFSSHPKYAHLLFVSLTARHAIYTLDISKPNQPLEKFAGVGAGSGGHEDGVLAQAEFKNLRQICFDEEGLIMYVADTGNHVIRQIDMEAGLVSTLAGTPGVSGHLDGGPEEALFKEPHGVKSDQNGYLFVVDKGNRLIRKIAIE